MEYFRLAQPIYKEDVKEKSIVVNVKLQKFDLEYTPRYWWLRSVYSNYSNFVGTVDYGGCVYQNGVHDYYEVFPVCLKI